MTLPFRLFNMNLAPWRVLVLIQVGSIKKKQFITNSENILPDPYGNLLRPARLPTRKRRSNVSSQAPSRLALGAWLDECTGQPPQEKKKHHFWSAEKYGNLLCGEIFLLFSRSAVNFRYISARRNIAPAVVCEPRRKSFSSNLRVFISAKVRFHRVTKKIGTNFVVPIFW